MTTRTRALLALLTIGTATIGRAQTPPPAPGKMPEHHKAMKDMQGMSDMMNGSHHVLAMAYRDNLATFAKALNGQVTRSNTVDPDVARPAVAEMRRSFDQIQQHHQAQAAMMADHMNPPMTDMMHHMDTHLTELGEHLTALESEVNAATPDPKKVAEHTSEILKQCTEMSAMPAMPKPKVKP
jgi:hypothetical protein